MKKKLTECDWYKSTVVPTTSDSNVLFCLQLLSEINLTYSPLELIDISCVYLILSCG